MEFRRIDIIVPKQTEYQFRTSTPNGLKPMATGPIAAAVKGYSLPVHGQKGNYCASHCGKEDVQVIK